MEAGLGTTMRLAAAILAVLALAPAAARAQTQTSAGERIFAARCASCHNGQPNRARRRSTR